MFSLHNLVRKSGSCNTGSEAKGQNLAKRPCINDRKKKHQTKQPIRQSTNPSPTNQTYYTFRTFSEFGHASSRRASRRLYRRRFIYFCCIKFVQFFTKLYNLQNELHLKSRGAWVSSASDECSAGKWFSYLLNITATTKTSQHVCSAYFCPSSKYFPISMNVDFIMRILSEKIIFLCSK